jgi:hypothetical protein
MFAAKFRMCLLEGGKLTLACAGVEAPSFRRGCGEIRISSASELVRYQQAVEMSKCRNVEMSKWGKWTNRRRHPEECAFGIFFKVVCVMVGG